MPPRLLGLAFFSSTVATSALLGAWQLSRRQWKTQLIQTHQDAYQQAPRRLCCEEMTQGTRLRLSGRYCIPSDASVVRVGLQMDLGETYSKIVLPFVTKEGSVVLVERGWLPHQHQRQTKETLDIPLDTTELLGVVRYSQEPVGLA